MKKSKLCKILNSLHRTRNDEEADAKTKAFLQADTAGELLGTRMVITNVGMSAALNVRFSSRNKTTTPYRKEDLPVPLIESGQQAEIKVIFEARRDAITLTWDDDHRDGNKRIQNIYFR